MRKTAAILCALFAASAALAIGSALVLDTTQPYAALTKLEAWQGSSLTLLVTVRQDGQTYTNAATLSMDFGTNTFTAPLTNGTAIIRSTPLAAGISTYTFKAATGSVTNPLGAGIINVNPTGFFGGN